MSTITSSAPTGVAGLPASLTKPGSVATATTAQEASDRFLKLLVTQLQNQDPMNPMDNAQMTSQMAQISTVSGIEKLNLTVEGLNSQFVQMQALQGASLIGKDVILKGDKLSKIDGDAVGTFQLDSAADRVKVEVLSAAGQLIDTLNLGAQTSGRHDFVWPAGAVRDDAANLRFRVSAHSGATALTVTPLMRDKVDAVNTSGKSLTLELERSGHVAYSAITAID
jgi:flagellar basal-body rod modification protein FlgD